MKLDKMVPTIHTCLVMKSMGFEQEELWFYWANDPKHSAWRVEHIPQGERQALADWVSKHPDSVIGAPTLGELIGSFPEGEWEITKRMGFCAVAIFQGADALSTAAVSEVEAYARLWILLKEKGII